MSDELKLIEGILVHADDEKTNRSWAADDVGWENVDAIWHKAEQLKKLLKEQEEQLRKLQKDKDKLCLEVSEWKHKFHDISLKEQEAKPPAIMQDIEGIWSTCSMCGHKLRPILAMKMDTYFPKFCSECGQAVKWDDK